MNSESEWDDYKFRQVLLPLLRYGLVQVSWNTDFVQIFMHPLVRWKANVEGERRKVIPRWDVTQAIFYACAVRQAWTNEYPSQKLVDALSFIRNNAPAAESFLSAPIDRMDSVLDMIGEQYERANRMNEAKHIYEAIAKASNEACPVVSKCYPNSIARMANLMTLASVSHLWAFQMNPLELSMLYLANMEIGNLPLSYNTLKQLETWLSSRGRIDQAEEVVKTMVKKSSRFEYATSDRHFWIMWTLAKLSIQQENWNEAEVILKEMEAIDKKNFERRWSLKNQRGNFWEIWRLARACIDHGRWDEADIMLKEIQDPNSEYTFDFRRFRVCKEPSMLGSGMRL
jgi:tetratricopeptide (TPR) repeat protein